MLFRSGLNAVAATAGTALGIGMIVNGYFGGIGAFVTGGALVGLALSVGLASLLAHTVAFAALAPRLARR